MLVRLLSPMPCSVPAFASPASPSVTAATLSARGSVGAGLLPVGAALDADGRLKDGDEDPLWEGREKLGCGASGTGGRSAIFATGAGLAAAGPPTAGGGTVAVATLAGVP